MTIVSVAMTILSVLRFGTIVAISISTRQYCHKTIKTNYHYGKKQGL